MIKEELDMPREQLLLIILDLKKKAAEEDAYRIENSDILLAMSKEYQALESEAAALRAENASLKEALSHTAQVS